MDANTDLLQVALRLATGAGKTTAMAMTITWQAINAVLHSNNRRFIRRVQVETPGIAIWDWRRVLQPNDPDSHYSFG